MALTLTRGNRKLNGGILIASFSIVASGSYATGGDAADFAPPLGFTNHQPDNVDLEGIAGFTYVYNYTTKKVMVFCNTAGGADQPLGELSAGAYPAGITGDTIRAIVTYIGLPKLS